MQDPASTVERRRLRRDPPRRFVKFPRLGCDRLQRLLWLQRGLETGQNDALQSRRDVHLLRASRLRPRPLNSQGRVVAVVEDEEERRRRPRSAYFERLREEFVQARERARKEGGSLPRELVQRCVAAGVVRETELTTDFFDSHCDELVAVLRRVGGMAVARDEVSLFTCGAHGVREATAWFDGDHAPPRPLRCVEETHVSKALCAVLRLTHSVRGTLELLNALNSAAAHAWLCTPVAAFVTTDVVVLANNDDRLSCFVETCVESLQLFVALMNDATTSGAVSDVFSTATYERVVRCACTLTRVRDDLLGRIVGGETPSLVRTTQVRPSA